MRSTLGLAGSKIIVTGASGFLGKIICEVLKREYVRVIEIDVNETSSVEKLDITDKEKFGEFYGIVYEHRGIDGYADGLINNAAVSFKGDNLSSKEFMKTLEVNVEGTYNCITQFKDVLKPNASIVNIASVYGMLSPDFRIYNNEHLYNSSAYGASKAAIIQLSKYYAAQLAPIRVNSISPGGIFQGHDDDFVKQYSDRVPLGRMANPEEIIDAILFLLSPMSSYITGQNLVVDGGMSIM